MNDAELKKLEDKVSEAESRYKSAIKNLKEANYELNNSYVYLEEALIRFKKAKDLN